MKYSEQIDDILQNTEEYHEIYYDVGAFFGPSLHFHRKAIQYINSSDQQRYLEYIYATLTSWGMHRMGPVGAKMVEFDEFYKSISLFNDSISYLRKFSLKTITNSEWEVLKKLFLEIKIMKSSIQLIGVSKVLAHLLPNLFAPIDRQYTLSHLKGSKYIRSGDREYEWDVAKDIHQNFFLPLYSNDILKPKLDTWLNNQKLLWDSSHLKIIDNLLIGAVKANS